MMHSNDTARCGGERGFTLIETAIALLILMVVGLGASSLFMYAVRYNMGASERAVALGIAQREIEEFHKYPFGDATLNATTVGTPTTTTATVANRNYTVAKDVCVTAGCGGSATLKLIRITVTPGATGNGTWASQPVTIETRRASHERGAYFMP